MKLQQMIAAMRAGGASNDVILASIEAAVAADAQELDKRKSQAADRQQRYMARKRGLTSADVSSRHLTSADVADASAYVSKRQSRQEPVAADDFGPATRVEDLGVPSSLLPKVTLEEEGRKQEDLQLEAPAKPKPRPEVPATNPLEWGKFWEAYPHKVGKPDALKAFRKARTRVEFEPLMAGLRAYAGKTDDRPWCNPSTWLNQDRWGDRPAPPVQRTRQAAPVDPLLQENRDVFRKISERAFGPREHYADDGGAAPEPPAREVHDNQGPQSESLLRRDDSGFLQVSGFRMRAGD